MTYTTLEIQLLKRLDALLEQTVVLFKALGSNQAIYGDALGEIDNAAATIKSVLEHHGKS